LQIVEINFCWIDNDRMVQVSGPGVLVTYGYDVAGQRVIETTASGTKKYLIDYQLPYGQVIGETDGSGNLTASYVYGLERITMTRGASTHTYVADGQGSIRQLTNANGNVTDSWTFDAFGNIINRTGTTVNTFTYVGEQYDANTGFYNLRARLYNPESGRFASNDPYEGDPEAPVSLHRYLYGNASPLKYSDPTGEFGIDECFAIFAIVGILATNAQAITPSNGTWVKGFTVDMTASMLNVEYTDGNKESYIAATGNPDYDGARVPAKGTVVSTVFGACGHDYLDSWQNDQSNPYGPAMLICMGTGGRHIHGTNGPLNGGAQYLTLHGSRHVTEGCCRVLNSVIIQLKVKVDKTLKAFKFITVEFKL